jgi:alpha-galactosidase
MTKITLLGAGSGFTQPLFTDVLNIEGLNKGVIGLVDIDGARLAVNVKLMHRILDLMGKKAWRVEASTNRRKILPGTDYLISTIEVSGVPCVRADNDIPLKYGIDQCIGDTIGPGGVMKILRTLPPFLEILGDAQRHCPRALILNYTNPMSMMTLGAVRTTSQPFVGLCHSVQGNSRQIAGILGVPYDELEWQCGGINHLAWFTTLRWKGQDMHARLRAAAEDPEVVESFPIRTDLIKNLGYFATESCGHFSEYVPYYRKRKDLLKLHCRDGYKGGTSFYADNWPSWRKATDKKRQEMADGKRDIPLGRGHEYASDIIEAHVFDRKKVIYASVRNTGLIPNLPQDGVVEVATLVDKRGFLPTYFGNLPEQCAALCRSNMALFELCVQGILNKDREAVIHGMMMDPLSAAACSLSEIRSMAEELFAEEKPFIPAWCAKPKVVVAAPRSVPITPFVRKVDVSPILPHADLATLDCPKPPTLGLKTRSFSDSFLNRHEELEKAGSALVYYRCRIRCATPMKLQARLGYDGPLKMWIDGKEVFFDPKGTNPAGRDKAKIPFAASKGTHEILVALDSNTGNAWGIALRLERLDLSKRDLAKGLKSSQLPVFAGQDFESGVAAVSSMSARNLAGGTRSRGRRRT